MDVYRANSGQNISEEDYRAALQRISDLNWADYRYRRNQEDMRELVRAAHALEKRSG